MQQLWQWLSWLHFNLVTNLFASKWWTAQLLTARTSCNFSKPLFRDRHQISQELKRHFSALPSLLQTQNHTPSLAVPGQTAFFLPAQNTEVRVEMPSILDNLQSGIKQATRRKTHQRPGTAPWPQLQLSFSFNSKGFGRACLKPLQEMSMTRICKQWNWWGGSILLKEQTGSSFSLQEWEGGLHSNLGSLKAQFPPLR